MGLDGAILKKDVDDWGGWRNERIPAGAVLGMLTVLEDADTDADTDAELDAEPDDPDAEPEEDTDPELDKEVEDEGTTARCVRCGVAVGRTFAAIVNATWERKVAEEEMW